ncbi:MAG: hypothetical protein FWB72_07500 [Firmicutes bacterium]|nr:hypothetical protein [Bacillota bacterium]
MENYFTFNSGFFVRAYPRDTVIEVVGKDGNMHTVFPKDFVKLDRQILILCRDTNGDVRVFREVSNKSGGQESENLSLTDGAGDMVDGSAQGAQGSAELGDTSETFDSANAGDTAPLNRAHTAFDLIEVDEKTKERALDEYQRLIEVSKLQKEVKRADKKSKRVLMMGNQGRGNMLRLVLIAFVILIVPDLIFRNILGIDDDGILVWIQISFVILILGGYIGINVYRQQTRRSGEAVPIYIYDAKPLESGERVVKNQLVRSNRKSADPFDTSGSGEFKDISHLNAHIPPEKLHDFNIVRTDWSIPFNTFNEQGFGGAYVLFYYVYRDNETLKHAMVIPRFEIKDYLLKCNRHTVSYNTKKGTTSLIILRERPNRSLELLREPAE